MQLLITQFPITSSLLSRQIFTAFENDSSMCNSGMNKYILNGSDDGAKYSELRRLWTLSIVWSSD
jgi:hypothetical protein